jgi:outer membrane protein TolC
VKIKSICLLFLGWTFSAIAAEVTPLTLERAIDIVKQQNLEVKSADYALKSAQEQTDIATSHHWGQLNFVQNIMRSNDAGNVFGFKLSSREASLGDFGFNDFFAWQGAGMPGGTAGALAIEPYDLNYPEDRNYFQSKLVYEVPLYAGGKIEGYSAISQAMERIQALDKSDVLNEKIYQTRKSYYDMALLEHSLENLNVILKNIETLETMIKTMMAEGYAKEVDLLEIKAKKANVVRLINQMKSNEELLYHFLSFLLNQPVNEIAIPASCDVMMPIINDDDLIMQNLDIQKASEALKIRQEMVTIANAGYLPQVGAFAELSTADDTFLGDASDHKSYTAGVQLKWNLFSGGADSGASEKARVEELKMRTQVELAKKGITLKLAQIRTEIKGYDEEIKSLESELELLEKIYESYETRYRENLASMSDVLIQQSARIEKILALQVVKNKRNERVFALEELANGEQQ